jgi:hypothetical protein
VQTFLSFLLGHFIGIGRMKPDVPANTPFVPAQRPTHTSRFKNAHFPPALPKSANANGRHVGSTANVFDVQQLVLAAECKEVSEERVEVRFGTQVKDLRVVCVVYMRKHTQELAIDVLDGRRERCRKVLA